MTDKDNKYTRRKMIKYTGASVASTALFSQSAIASEERTDLYGQHQPNHVSISYEENKEIIENYEPYLNTLNLDIKPESCFAAYYESNEYDTDVIMYLYYYPTQIGNYGPFDSHYHDREPVFVFIDDDGGVDKVSYSAWHYLINHDLNPYLEGETHVKLNVANPHNHFYSEPETEDGSFHNLFDGIPQYNYWYKNNWDIDPAILVEPWLINSRTSLWEDDIETIGGITINWNATNAIFALRIARLDPRINIQTDI